MNRKRTLVGMAVVAVMVVGIAVPAAIAQDADEPATEATDRPDREMGEEHQQAFAEALAEELGLDDETVADAVATVREDLAEQRRARMGAALDERLDTAVENGALTQQQADAIREVHDSGALRELREHWRDNGRGPFGSPGGGPGHGPGHFHGGPFGDA